MVSFQQNWDHGSIKKTKYNTYFLPIWGVTKKKLQLTI